MHSCSKEGGGALAHAFNCTGRLDNISLDIDPWDEYDEVKYLADVARHQMVVTIETEWQRSAVYRKLRYAKRFRGRGLCAPVRVGLVQLFAGDRLEPSPSLLDVSRFSLTAVPFQATFWRMQDTDRVTHASPLLEIEGFFLDQHGVDILHTWHLGPIIKLIPMVLRFFLRMMVFVQPVPYLTADDTKRIGLLRMKHKLFTFYAAKRSSDPMWKRKRAEVWNLTEGMIFNKGSEMKVKAAEARGLLEFCDSLLNDYMPVFRGRGGDDLLMAQYLYHSCQAAMRFESLLESNPRSMGRPQREALWNAYIKHVTLYLRAGGSFMPKHHLMLHLLKRVFRRGNPKCYGTYKDESLNGVIARIARSCHRSCFGLSVHLKYSILQQITGELSHELKARP